MNTPLPPGPNEGLHDDDLPGEAELAALYRKLSKREPGPALDAAVLRAAAEALTPVDIATSRPPLRTSHMRWWLPLSSAATLVLAAGLAWHMRSMPVAEPTLTNIAPPPIAPLPAAPSPITSAQNFMVPQITLSEKLAIKMPAATNAYADIATAPLARERLATSARSAKLSQRQASYAARPKPPHVAETTDSAANVSTSSFGESEAPAILGGASMIAPAPTMTASSDMLEKNSRDTPVQELEKIRQLFAAHRNSDAQARLQTFQREHADQPLPPDLRARLSDIP